MSLSKTDNSQKSVDIYKELFGLPVYYTGMYEGNDNKGSSPSSNMNVWQKMKRAMRELHTVNEKVNKSKEKGKYQLSYRRRRRRSSRIDGNKNASNSGGRRRISAYDINSEKERINQLVMTLPSIDNNYSNKEKEIEKPIIEKPETPLDYYYYHTPIPPINPSPVSHRNNGLRKKRSVIIKPITSPRRASKFYEINEEGEVLPKYSPVKCV